MRIVFMGTPEFAVKPLQSLALNNFNIVAVYTQPDREAGRGRSRTSPPVKIGATALGIPVLQPANLKSSEEQARLEALHPDIIIVAAYGQILRRAVLSMPRHGCLNVHPSLLPAYRGVSPVAAAILNGNEFTGVSIMRLDEGVDTGSVLARAQVPINRWDTTGTLTEKLSYVGGALLTEVLPRWIEGKINPVPQDNALASYTKMVQKESGEIDWQRPAVAIWRQVRACQPWPGSFTRWQGKQLKIVTAIPLDGRGSVPGRVVTPGEKIAVGIETGEGILGIMQIQLEGKRVMSGEEFIRGQRALIGTVLPS